MAFSLLSGYLMPRCCRATLWKRNGFSEIAGFFYVGQLMDCVVTKITEEGKVTVNLPGEKKPEKNEPETVWRKRRERNRLKKRQPTANLLERL